MIIFVHDDNLKKLYSTLSHLRLEKLDLGIGGRSPGSGPTSGTSSLFWTCGLRVGANPAGFLNSPSPLPSRPNVVKKLPF
uniref:Uncharacterized protein n=1 Tax=Romanomermis culicivorax TaxID=13658 RepID=A0A915JGX3_ROMCU